MLHAVVVVVIDFKSGDAGWAEYEGEEKADCDCGEEGGVLSMDCGGRMVPVSEERLALFLLSVSFLHSLLCLVGLGWVDEG